MPGDQPPDLTQAAQVAFAGGGNDADLSRLPRPRQVFVMVYSAQGVIDNGGFAYFFECDWPGVPPYSAFSEAYREIGAAEAADLIDRAAGLFGIADPHLHREERLRYLHAHTWENGGELVTLGDRIESECVFRLLGEYVRRHPDHFCAA
ncbi:MAG: DUF4375 domain-containing protein [Verrucomicrobia bacterium]|nr:DUF4375 domain-containing protein [Verrucomicrobiota bacterium]